MGVLTSVIAIGMLQFLEDPAAIKGENFYTLYGGFTTILVFLIVFRTTLAYNRYWDGATMCQEMRGTWFSSYSGLLSFCSVKAGLGRLVAGSFLWALSSGGGELLVREISSD